MIPLHAPDRLAIPPGGLRGLCHVPEGFPRRNGVPLSWNGKLVDPETWAIWEAWALGLRP